MAINNEKLEKYRMQIDTLDKEIMSLLEQRFACSLAVGNLKKQSTKAILDSKREAEILQKCKNFTYEESLYEVYQIILRKSKELQK